MLNLSTFHQSIIQLLPEVQQKTFLLAISGGVDSMVLADLFIQSGYYFEIAHVNYHLRNEDSNLDQELVEKFCLEHNIKFHLYNVSEKDNQPQNSIENWARDIRYTFFRNLLKDQNLDFIVTAHHLNDQLETFVINLSKASGLRGLSGIPNLSNQLIRPFLDFTKEEIYDYAKKNKIDFREDYTNAENIFLRNKIRNQITPLLLETNSQFLENFKISNQIIKDSKTFIEQQILKIENDLTISTSQQEIVLDKIKLNQESDFVKFEIFRKYGLDNPTEINKLLIAETGKYFLSKTHKIGIMRDGILIQNNEIIEADFNEIELSVISENDNETVIAIPIKYIDKKEIQDFKSWIIDKEKIKFPLLLRYYNNEDVFYPKGFTGKKKVSKFLKDKKMSIFVRSRVWILVDSDDQILGVIPYRQDRRFLGEEKSSNFIRIIID